MFFDFPPSTWLRNAFLGAQAWVAREKLSSRAPGTFVPVKLTKVVNPNKAFAGFTLYATWSGSQALLVDMGGRLVHKWSAPFSRVWPSADHVRQRPDYDVNIYFFALHLYKNGDLLAVYQAYDDTPYGYGLTKLDKNSRVIWKYSGNVHHDVDVGKDGTIYALTHTIVRELPRGLDSFPSPSLVDSLVMLSPSGVELKRIPILEAFRDSPYSLLLNRRRSPQGWNVLHTNAARVLTAELAPQFPMFKAGQVLISVRKLGTIRYWTRIPVWSSGRRVARGTGSTILSSWAMGVS